jgi:hypothetical protein
MSLYINPRRVQRSRSNSASQSRPASKTAVASHGGTLTKQKPAESADDPNNEVKKHKNAKNRNALFAFNTFFDKIEPQHVALRGRSTALVVIVYGTARSRRD